MAVVGGLRHEAKGEGLFSTDCHEEIPASLIHILIGRPPCVLAVATAFSSLQRGGASYSRSHTYPGGATAGAVASHTVTGTHQKATGTTETCTGEDARAGTREGTAKAS